MNNFRIEQDIWHRACYVMSLIDLKFSREHIADYFENHKALRSMNE